MDSINDICSLLISSTPFDNHNLYLRSILCQFGPMFNWIRTHNRKLMLIVAVLTIIAFAVLYNTSQIDQLGKERVAQIYDRTLTQADLRKEVRAYQVALALGLTNLVRTLGDPTGGDAAVDSFVFNVMVVRHETERLGLAPSEQQVKDAIEKMETFQTNGQFDFTKYQAFVTEQLIPRGFNEREIENVVRDSLRLDLIEAVLGTAPTATEAEVGFAYRTFERVTGAGVRFDVAKYLDAVTVTEDELKTDFERKKPRLLTNEFRSVRYVVFALPPDQAALEGRERIDALQELADRSSNLVDTATASSLEKAAADAGLTVETTPNFDADGEPEAVEGETNPREAPSPIKAIAPTAFTLTESDPVSGVIQDENSFYVVELANEIPSRPMSFEEAREQLVGEIKVDRASSALADAAQKAVAEIRAQVASGKAFAEAASAVGAVTVPINGISPSDENATPEERFYADAMTLLDPGQISGIQVGPAGAFAVYLEKRDRDEKDFEERKDDIAEFIRRRKSSILLIEWLESARQNAGLRILGEG
jgi:peptidyl-prolyl cis-trans isomerase D